MSEELDLEGVITTLAQARPAVVCPSCHAPEEVADGQSADLSQVAVFRCEHCGLRVSYGVETPRVVVEPTRGPHGWLWVRVRVQDSRTKADLFVFDIDPALAHGFADGLHALVSLLQPKVIK